MTDNHDSTPPTFPISRNRLEFLFDGIFAIAMTILVLELKVPEELADRRSVAELAAALGHSAATFVSYLLSFGMLGVMWYLHNHCYRHLQHITIGMFALHLVQLAAAAFFPFCAALFGRFPTNALSLVFYTGCITVYLWASLATWLLAVRARAISPHLEPAEARRIRNRMLRGCAFVTVFFASYLLRALAS